SASTSRAAVLAGCAARLVDAERRVRVRVEADGTRRDSTSPPDPAWPSAALTPGGASALWLERTAQAAPSVVDAVILERAAGAVRIVLDRTRGRVPLDDPESIETLLDPTAPEAARLHAARRLGLDPADPATRARAVAPLDGPPRVVAALRDTGIRSTPLTPHPDGDPQPAQDRTGAQPPHTDAELPAGRLGIGPAVPVLDLPRSWAAARTALRFTSDGTAQDPGRRIVHADDLGGIALLAELVVPGAEPPPDVQDVEAAAATAPWLLATLNAVATTTSLRAAATEINVHHSTLQDRLTHAESLLGWPVRTPQGRLRLQLALTMRHLARP
ncbi:helix-turn-helix domain-containing protein, partial [Streptomyces sp. MBT65]